MSNSGVYFDCVIPKFCSECGNELCIGNYETRQDYLNHNSFSCGCGTKYIHVKEENHISKEITDELNHYR